MRSLQLFTLLAFAWIAGPAANAHADVIFDFESVPLGTATAFSYTQGGITARFSSPGDPGGFQVTPSFFRDLTGHVLLDPGPSMRTFIPLVVNFSEPLANIRMNFATDDAPPTFSTFRLEAFSGGIGGTLVGTATAVGTIPPGFMFPEGAISFDGNGTAFDTLRFSTIGPAPFFAVDNLAVNIAVPEPGTFALLGIGALGLLSYYWRRRSAPE